MSLHCGLWNLEHFPVARERIANARSILSAYGSRALNEYAESDIHILHLPLSVTPESAFETQPFLSRNGNLFVWDGRLDNRVELIGLLREELRNDASDVAVVAVAFERWGMSALAKLVGDWALAVWNPKEPSVLLAKDFLGTKSLYYTIGETGLAWSSILDLLLPAEGTSIRLDEEYIAGWFSQFPAPHLTPFAGIRAVPPASYILVRPANTILRQYWDFDPAKRITCRDDREYEEHFLIAFGESVRRRLRSRTPVLAELSGGMDSSSIVCMADALLARGFSETPRLDTISCFEPSEPNWNELPFIELVEQRRGRAGHRVAVDFRNYWHPSFDPEILATTPGSGTNLNEGADYGPVLRSAEYCVLLQGIGGDEVLGGVPTPLPELADLFLTGRFRLLLPRLVDWAIASQTPAVRLFADTLRLFLPSRPALGGPAHPVWLSPHLIKRQRQALDGYSRRLRVLGPLPSFQANLASLETLRRHVAAFGRSPLSRVERRYPYLDRDLLEFLFAIPREQLVRPNQRRSLMRRALEGIVPSEILKRGRKGFIARGPIVSFRTELPHLLARMERMVAVRLGIVDGDRFRNFLGNTREADDIAILPVLRTLVVEAWLTNLVRWRKVEPCEQARPRKLLSEARRLIRSQDFFG